MTKYNVRITQSADYVVVIEAANADAAEEAVRVMAEHQDIGQFADMVDGSFEIWDVEEVEQ